RRDCRGDPADATDGAVDVLDARLDAVHARELRDQPLAQAQDARRRGVADRRRPRKLDRRLDDVLRGSERRLADLEPDATRRDEGEIDDLADARMGRLRGPG